MKALRIFFIIGLSNFFPLFANAGFVVLGKMIYKYSAQKGETYSTVFKVSNLSELSQEVRIYQSDYLFNFQGEFFYNEPGSNKRSNAPWIQYNPKTIILKGKETQDVLFQVTVPSDKTLAGTYWSVLMVEGVTPLSPNNKGQLNIHESVRYAIQIVTNIGNTGIGQLEFQNPGIIKEGNNSFFDFVMVNTGERFISPDVSLELIDATIGTSIKIIKAPKNGMYPTTSTKWRFSLEGIPTGKTYKAVIVADGSGDDVFGFENTIVL